MSGWVFPHRIYVAIFKEENKIHLTQTITELLFHDSKEIIMLRGFRNSQPAELSAWDLDKLAVTR